MQVGSFISLLKNTFSCIEQDKKRKIPQPAFHRLQTRFLQKQE